MVLETEMNFHGRLKSNITKERFPNAKFLKIVCEPSARFFSEFVHRVIGGRLLIKVSIYQALWFIDSWKDPAFYRGCETPRTNA